MRMGAKKRPFYRVVVADSRMPNKGRFLEMLGIYDPLKEPEEIRIDSEKTLGWLSKGAQPSDRVKNLLKKSGVISQPKEAQKGVS